MAWAAAIPALVNIAGSLIGNNQASGDRKNADRMNQEMLDYIKNIDIPDIEKQKLYSKLYESAGTLSNQSELAQQLGARDALEDVQLDPRLKQTQMANLDLLTKLGQTSFTPEEQAQLNVMKRQTEQDNSARLKSLLEGQQARGMGTSDAGLAIRAQAAQSQANRQSEETDRLAAMAHQRALAAMGQASGLAGNMESADYGRQANLAQALNQRELTNMQQKAGAGTRNVDRFNDAQRYNLSQAQSLANANVDLGNSDQRFNKGLIQQKFQNETNKATLMSNPSATVANNMRANEAATRNMWGGISQGAQTAIGGYQQYQTNLADQARADSKQAADQANADRWYDLERKKAGL